LLPARLVRGYERAVRGSDAFPVERSRRRVDNVIGDTVGREERNGDMHEVEAFSQIIAATQLVMGSANAFNDAINGVLTLIDGAKVGLVTLVIVVAGLTAAFTRGHKGEVLGGAVFACALILGAKSIATALGA